MSLINDTVIGNGSAVIDTAYLYPSRLRLGKFHRSKDTVATTYQPFASYMVNKKWWLEEQFNTHMLRFQQVATQFYIFTSLRFDNPRLV